MIFLFLIDLSCATPLINSHWARNVNNVSSLQNSSSESWVKSTVPRSTAVISFPFPFISTFRRLAFAAKEIGGCLRLRRMRDKGVGVQGVVLVDAVDERLPCIGEGVCWFDNTTRWVNKVWWVDEGAPWTNKGVPGIRKGVPWIDEGVCWIDEVELDNLGVLPGLEPAWNLIDQVRRRLRAWTSG